jgi:hypothetical protein
MRISLFRLSGLAAAFAVSLAACGADSRPETTAHPPSGVVAQDAAPEAIADAIPAEDARRPVDETPDTASAGVPDAALAMPPPDAASWLAAAFPGAALGPRGRDGGPVLPDGREVQAWFDQRLAYKGSALHVAFLGLADPTSAAPGDTVEIAQATSRFVDGGWQPVSASAGIGRFGGRGRAPMVDGAQDARVHVDGERLVLAVPTEDAANSGIVVYGYELFAAEGEPLTWRHVGRLPAGSDNRAGCSDAPDAALPCASAAGTLEFAGSEDSPWPTLRLALQGTVVEGPGTVRATLPTDVVILRFDPTGGRYVPSTPIPDAAY